MVDFHQPGLIPTMHALHDPCDREEYLRFLEDKIEHYSQRLHVCLLLPCLYAEMQNGKTLKKIVDEIKQVRYLRSVVVAMGGTSKAAEFKKFRTFFRQLQTPDREVRVVWIDGPRVQDVFHMLQTRALSVGLAGKGQSVWAALGYVFARRQADVIALHDCDILTYDRMLLARLIEPVANPNNDFEFCKGFYPRISPQEKAMKGRVTRLFVLPFVDTLRDIMALRGHPDLVRFFSYHRSFYYALAGEVCFSNRVGRTLNVAYDWAVEVSTLSEVFKRVALRNVCQIDLSINYDHRHQALSAEDRNAGLHRMVVDIAKHYLFYIRSSGFPLDEAMIQTIRLSYYQNALKYVKIYSDDAAVNQLNYDRYQEEQSVQFFRDFIWTAWEQSCQQFNGTQIPSWNRVLFSVPGIYERILDAVNADNER